eukprot:365424-Chlamydomonas_euryale.AAC.20
MPCSCNKALGQVFGLDLVIVCMSLFQYLDRQLNGLPRNSRPFFSCQLIIHSRSKCPSSYSDLEISSQQYKFTDLADHARALVGLAVDAVRTGLIQGHRVCLAGGVQEVLARDGVGVHAGRHLVLVEHNCEAQTAMRWNQAAGLPTVHRDGARAPERIQAGSWASVVGVTEAVTPVPPQHSSFVPGSGMRPLVQQSRRMAVRERVYIRN